MEPHTMPMPAPGSWWIDYHDADGRRHRKKAAPDYQTARIIYRDTITAIAGMNW